MVLEFFKEFDLTFEHVKALTHAMFAVARVDGVHDREMTMIRQFYDSCARLGDPALEEVVGSSNESDLGALFDTGHASRMFVKSLILLAFADGRYASSEDALIRDYAGKVSLTSLDVDQLHEATKDYLLSSLAHIHNVEALADVARRLEMC
jgi:hypothetical protein